MFPWRFLACLNHGNSIFFTNGEIAGPDYPYFTPEDHQELFNPVRERLFCNLNSIMLPGQEVPALKYNSLQPL